MTRVTDEQLRAWAEAAERATPGPWTTEKLPKDADGWPTCMAVAATFGRQYVYAPSGSQYPNADQRFIALAREAVPALLAEHAEQARELAELRAKAAAFERVVAVRVQGAAGGWGVQEFSDRVGDAIDREARALAAKEGRDV